MERLCAHVLSVSKSAFQKLNNGWTKRLIDEEVKHFVELGDRIGVSFALALLPILKINRLTMRYLVSFLEKAVHTRTWTDRRVIQTFCTDLLQPAMRTLRYMPRNPAQVRSARQHEVVNTLDLLVLVECLQKLGLHMELEKLVRLMASLPNLETHKFEHVLDDHLYTLLLFSSIPASFC